MNMEIGYMNTTRKLPGPPFREAKAAGRANASEPAWMKGFGKLKRLHKETVRVQSVIDREFEVLETEDHRGR